MAQTYATPTSPRALLSPKVYQTHDVPRDKILKENITEFTPYIQINIYIYKCTCIRTHEYIYIYIYTYIARGQSSSPISFSKLHRGPKVHCWWQERKGACKRTARFTARLHASISPIRSSLHVLHHLELPLLHFNWLNSLKT